MCPPEHFTVEYAINPWMDTTVPVDPALALKQWHLLRDTLTMLRPGGVLYLQTPHWTRADRAAHALEKLTGGRLSQVPDRRIAQHHWILHTRASITAQLNRLGYVDVVAEPQVRYTLTSQAYLASMNPPGWTLKPMAKALDAAISSGLAPHIVLDVRARKPGA